MDSPLSASTFEPPVDYDAVKKQIEEAGRKIADAYLDDVHGDDDVDVTKSYAIARPGELYYCVEYIRDFAGGPARCDDSFTVNFTLKGGVLAPVVYG